MLVLINENSFNLVREHEWEGNIIIKYSKIDGVYYLSSSEPIFYCDVDYNLLDYTKCINVYKENFLNKEEGYGLKIYFVNNNDEIENLRLFTVKLSYKPPEKEAKKQININIKPFSAVFNRGV